MRAIDRPSSFKRDYKREAKGQHRATLDADLMPVLKALVVDQPLEARYNSVPGTVYLIPRRRPPTRNL
jgi:mRNA interferase YafQ